jgi:hypothetical protein
MPERKVNEQMAAAMAEAHADGVSIRACAKLYGVSPTLAARYIHRATPAPSETPGPEANEEHVEVPPSGTPKRHVEHAFPEFAVPDETLVVVTDPDAERRARAERREAATRAREQEDHDRQLARWEKWQDDMAALRVEERRARGNADAWKDVRRRMKKRGPEPNHPDAYIPSAYETGVRVSMQYVDDRPPVRLGENPYDRGPRGFTIVGEV